MQENSLMTIADFKIEKITAETTAALETHNTIITSMRAAADAMVTFCRSLKNMRDTAGYKELGFEKFEDYTENACGIKKRQAYNYIQIYESLGASFLQSNAQLGVTKLQLLTELCAVERDDFVGQHDIDGMSVAEVKKLVAENNHRGEQIDLLQNELDEIKKRPIDVAVEQPSEADIKKLVDERTERIEKDFAIKTKELWDDYKKKLAAAKEKAQKTAQTEKNKAAADAAAKARAEVKSEYESQLKKAEADRAEALEQAEKMAAKLDKNADADLVTASLYFTEAQKQLENFTAAVAKIEAADPGKAAKLRSVASSQLRRYIESENNK